MYTVLKIQFKRTEGFFEGNYVFYSADTTTTTDVFVRKSPINTVPR